MVKSVPRMAAPPVFVTTPDTAERGESEERESSVCVERERERGV